MRPTVVIGLREGMEAALLAVQAGLGRGAHWGDGLFT